MKSLRSSLVPLCLVVAAGLVWVTGCSKGGAVAKHLADADRHFGNREFEKAKIEYINVLRAQPTNGFAVLRLGKILLAQGQFLEAAPMVAWSRRAFPDDLEMREAFVEILGAAGGETNRVRLMAEIDELLQRDPASQKALLTLAEASRTAEEVAGLTNRLAELRSKAGDRPVFKLVEAELLRRSGDTNGCERTIRAAIQIEPTNVMSQATLAAFLLSQRRIPEGEAALKAAAELAPPYGSVRERWGRYLFQNRRLEEAKVVLDEINAKAPERVNAWTVRAEVAVAEQKWEDAERFLARALAMAPNNAESLRVQAQIRLAQGKTADAVRDLEKVAQRQPGSARSQFQLGVAHLMNKDALSAVNALEESVQNEPGFADAVLLLADLNLRRGESEKASAALRDLVRRDPGNERAHLQLIRTDRARGREEDALQVARTARERFPSNPVVPFQMGFILRQQKKSAEARAAFEASMALSSNNLPAFEQIVALDVEAKDFQGALGRVQARIDQTPREPLLWLVKSEVHRAQNDVAQSEAALRKALEIDPESVSAFMALARLYLATGKQKEGMAELDQVLQRRPEDLDALQLAGMTRTALGDYEVARDLYLRMLKVQPLNLLALNNLAELKAGRFNQLDEARELATKARQAAPEDPVIADTLGWIEYRRGQYADALRLITEASARLAELPEIQYHLGMTHYMMGQEVPARAALQIAVASPRDFEGKAVARDYLAMLEVDSGKVDEGAIRALEQRRKEAPGDVIALTRLGTAYDLSGAFAKAQEAYEAALKVNPQSVPVLSRLAALYAGRLNNPTRALELARTARGLAPSDPEVGYALGRLAYGAGDQAWAYSLLQESVRRLTNRVEASFALAQAAYSIGRIDEAVRALNQIVAAGGSPEVTGAAAVILEMNAVATNTSPAAGDAARVQKVLDADPDHPAALYAYGIVAESQGNYPNARAAYERLLGRYAAFTPAIRQLAVLYSERLGDDAKAQEFGSRARQAYPRDDTLAAALGKALARRGDFGYAVQLLTEAARTRANDASLFYHLGVAQMGLEKGTEAVKMLEKALSLDPAAAFGDDAKKRLEKLKGG